MSLESIKSQAINAVIAAKNTAVHSAKWFGRTVVVLSYKVMDLLSAAGKTALYYLNALKNHIISFAIYAKTNLPIQLGKAKSFVIAHKEATLGIIAILAFAYLVNKFFFTKSEKTEEITVVENKSDVKAASTPA
jgi:hypothetical protein